MVNGIEQKTFTKRKYIGVKQKVKFEDISKKETYAAAFEKLGKYIAEEGIIPSGPAAVVYFTWDPETQITEMAPSFQVSDVTESKSDDIKFFEIPETEAAVAHHEGDYSTLKDAYDEMMKYVEENQIETNWCVEEYLVDPMQKPDPADWRTDIWFLKK